MLLENLIINLADKAFNSEKSKPGGKLASSN